MVLRNGGLASIFAMALPASNIFPIALCDSAAILFAMALGQQQTSSDGEEYTGLASNLAHLSRIC